MVLSSEQRETMQKWLPLILAILGIWWVARGIRSALRIAFGFFWVWFWAPGVFDMFTLPFSRFFF